MNSASCCQEPGLYASIDDVSATCQNNLMSGAAVATIRGQCIPVSASAVGLGAYSAPAYATLAQANQPYIDNWLQVQPVTRTQRVLRSGAIVPKSACIC